jgi:Flp pilus assembly protein TadB
VSKLRAQRRMARLAQAEKERTARERSAARRARRRAVARALKPRLPDRRTGRLYPRRTRTQRITITLGAAIALGLIWWGFDGLATRIALSALVLVALPAMIVLTYDRR